ncbi:MAG: hypothetical protein K2X82_21955 [Gemmataceae bacterium]|nr:hypothetical protein [Gemmataceae bacterium]
MPPTRRFPRRAAGLAGGCLLTVAAAVVLAHEGHAPMPTRGVVVDAAEGHLTLSADARGSLDVETAPVEPAAIQERVPADAVVVAPWPNRGFAAPKLAGRVV